MFVFALGGNGKIYGPRSPGVQDELGECRVLQADRCLLHGSGALGNDISLQCSGRYVWTPVLVPWWMCLQHDVVLFASNMTLGVPRS